MKQTFPLVLALLLPAAAGADTVLATRNLRAMQVLGPGDLRIIPQEAPNGHARSPEEVIGLEARVTIYAGRPIALASLSAPAIVERNALVTLMYQSGSLEIRTEGRALGRGAQGEEIRVMNLTSRATVSGVVAAPNLIRVDAISQRQEPIR